MPLLSRWIDLPIRLLLASIFLVSGLGKLAAVATTQAYMTAFGIPAVLVWPAAIFEIGSGLLLVAGFKLRPLGLVLAVWCVLTALIFHTHLADQNQLVNFLKNLVMAGGFLLLARTGAPGLGIDGRRAGSRFGSD